jgi:hypothetical protein
MDACEMGSGFSNGEWLCCSLFASSAHSSRRNLLTCHLIYQWVYHIICHAAKRFEPTVSLA